MGFALPLVNVLEESAKAEMELSAQGARIAGRTCRYCGDDFSCVVTRFIGREDQQDENGYIPVDGIEINACACVDRETGEPIQSFDLFGTTRAAVTLRRIAEETIRRSGADCVLVSVTERFPPDSVRSVLALNLDTDSAGNVVYRALR